MLGYHPTSNAKSRGGSIKEKKQTETVVSWTSHKHLSGLIYIDMTIYSNKHKHIQTHNNLANAHTHLFSNNHTYNTEAILTWTYTKI